MILNLMGKMSSCSVSLVVDQKLPSFWCNVTSRPLQNRELEVERGSWWSTHLIDPQKEGVKGSSWIHRFIHIRLWRPSIEVFGRMPGLEVLTEQECFMRHIRSADLCDVLGVGCVFTKECDKLLRETEILSQRPGSTVGSSPRFMLFPGSLINFGFWDI